jgi:hypothetical protein
LLLQLPLRKPDIYDELNAYKETGQVLGSHPILKLTNAAQKFYMDQAELIAYKVLLLSIFRPTKDLLETTKTMLKSKRLLLV